VLRHCCCNAVDDSRLRSVFVAHLHAVERTTTLLQNSDHAFRSAALSSAFYVKLRVTEQIFPTESKRPFKRGQGKRFKKPKVLCDGK
jgi:hypothetical protein